MVDVMAPVFDNTDGEGSQTRLRRARPDKYIPRSAPMGGEHRRRTPVRRRHHARDERRRRDEDSSDEDSESDDERGGGGRRGRTKTTTTQTQALTTASSVVAPQSFPTLSVSSAASSLPIALTPSPAPSATRTASSSVAPASNLGPLPTVSDPAVVANPQQSVPALTVVPSDTTTSTSVLAGLPAFTLSSNPRKGQDSATTEAPTAISSSIGTATGTAQSSPAAAFDTLPAPTILIDDSGYDGNDRDHDNHHNGPPGGLSPTAEDVLISAGSIGAFILICFVVWIGWRTLKKTKKPDQGSRDTEYSSPNNFLAKIPYFGRHQRAWQEMSGPGVDMREAPPMYDAKVMSSDSSIYSTNDPRHVSQTMSARGMPIALPELQTNFNYSTGGQPFSASTMNAMIQPTSAQSMRSLASMQNALRASQGQQQQQVMELPQLHTDFSSSTMSNNPFASPHDVSNPSTLSPQAAAQYSNGTVGTSTLGNGTLGNGTMETFDSLSTDRSRMPDAYFNQSELARQASTAYDPTKRAVYRASELSSISSGFGDGDFIIPPLPVAFQQQDGEIRPISYAKSISRSRSNSVANGHGQRDTVYTTTSEDMPARYRSVNSWVNQQTGRVQRQQARDDDADVPPVPSLPAEDRYTLMMDDGEVPRSYEDTMSSQPPVPPVPTLSQNSKSENPDARK